MFVNGNSLSTICDILTREKIKTPSISKNMNIGQKNLHYGVWSTRTVNDILKCPTYIGNLTQGKQKKVNYKSKKRIHNKEENWIIKENAVTPIIEKDVFELVQNMFKSNKNRQGNGITDKLLLRGLIYCKDYHHTMGFRAHKQLTKKMVKSLEYMEIVITGLKEKNVCTPHSVKYNDIETLVINDLKNMCIKYLSESNLENILLSSDKLKKEKI